MSSKIISFPKSKKTISFEDAVVNSFEFFSRELNDSNTKILDMMDQMKVMEAKLNELESSHLSLMRAY